MIMTLRHPLICACYSTALDRIFCVAVHKPIREQKRGDHDFVPGLTTAT
jgi:hypothetical protein